MRGSALLPLLVLLLLSPTPTSAAPWNPVPPCLSPFPQSAVNETWCSSPLATNASSGVTVAQYGLPANATLVTAATSPAIWYDEALFYLGGGIASVFGYMSGVNARNKSIIGDARTVPFIIRPLSPLASPAGTWSTSMLISTANFPEVESIPPPNPSPDLRLEPLGLHTFATLDFPYTNPPGLMYPSPPYFTYFLRCDEQLAAGLPSGWAIKADSVWTTSWLLYNGQDFNETWTCRCLAEVEPSPAGAAATTEPPRLGPDVQQQEQQQHMAPPVTAGIFQTDDAAPLLPRRLSSTSPPPPPIIVGSGGPADAPPICGILLEFETFAWGLWTPPHAPNVAIPGIDGGTYGRAAIDVASGTAYMATSADGPFFTLRLAAIDVATGNSRTIGNNWPLPPPGFSGVNGLFFTVDFQAPFGLVIGMTEVTKYGPLPTSAEEPGLPVGWTVVASVDPVTSASTALTADLTPALAPFPPIVEGISGLDGARSMLWLAALDSPVTAAPQRRWQSRPPRRQSPSSPSSVFLGVALSNTPAPQAPPPTVIPTLGDGLQVTSFKYSSGADALITLEFNGTGIAPYRPWNLAAGAIVSYPVNGSAPTVLGLIKQGTVNPGFQAEVSADGRYVYFVALQGSAEFESTALFTVDAVAGTVHLDLAAPDDEYDVLALFKCTG
jgi:hypothetical protein